MQNKAQKISTQVVSFNITGASPIVCNGLTTLTYKLNCLHLVKKIIVKCGYFITSDKLDIIYNSQNSLPPVAGSTLFTLGSNPLFTNPEYTFTQDLTDASSNTIYFKEPTTIVGDYSFNLQSTNTSTISGHITLLFEMHL